MGKEIMSWQEALKAHAEQAKQRVQKLTASTSTMLSFKHGKLRIGGEDLDNPIEVVVLALRGERNYFETEYDPDTPGSPDCYSYDGETPHPEAASPQAERCASCQWNEFGTKGRGKACKEGGRMALVFADQLNADLDVVDILQAKTSVNNTKYLRSYTERLAGPLFLFTTLISNEPDPKTQYRLSFRTGSKIVLDNTLGPLLLAKVEEAERLLATPYPQQEAKPAKPKGGVRRSRF
jgi:hypothetical protein